MIILPTDLPIKGYQTYLAQTQTELKENVDSDSNLFGSANIEAWLHLNIINKVK